MSHVFDTANSRRGNSGPSDLVAGIEPGNRRDARAQPHRRREPESAVMADSPPLRVLIAGGGVAGLEALLALRDLAGHRVELTLLSRDTDFVYRPMAIAEPFGRGRADHHPLRDIAADTDAELIRDTLVEVNA